MDIVVIAYPQTNREKLNYIINVCQKYFVTVKIIPELSEYYSKHFTYSFVGNIPLISIPLDRLSETHWKIIKRAFDIILTLVVTVTGADLVVSHYYCAAKDIRSRPHFL